MFSFLKKKKRQDKPVALVFVDYEHWYIALNNLHHIRPNVKAFYAALSRRVEVKDMLFFADFSGSGMSAEVPKIREVSNMIIETSNMNREKDFTDFIMLDQIYQRAMTDTEVDEFIIFSGDGHFSSVASFLRNVRKKTVGVYAVKNSLSLQLRNTANYAIELPTMEFGLDRYQTLVLKNLEYLRTLGKPVFPTFHKTVTSVSARYHVPGAKVRLALQELIEASYISSEKMAGRKEPVLLPDWKKLRENGVYICKNA